MWLVGLLVLASILAMLATVVGPLSPLAGWDVAWTTASAAAVAGIFAARQTAVPANRTRWTLWAAASACWLVGQVAGTSLASSAFPSLRTSPTPDGGPSPC